MDPPTPDGAEPTDEELLTTSVTDPGSFTPFYDRHAERLLAFFARRTLDAQSAADLTAETFAQAFGSRHRFVARGAGSAAAWLYGIAAHQLGRFFRGHRVEDRARQRLGIERLEVGAADIERIEELMDLVAVGRSLGRALDKLNERQREAITMRVVEGRAYADIARALACSEDVVRARVSRGLRRLAVHVQDPRGEVG